MRQKKTGDKRITTVQKNRCAALLVCASGLFAATAPGAEHHPVPIGQGSVVISGSLTESACRLEMTSLHQVVWLGNIDTASLRRPGDRAAPVSFQLKLEDCGRGPTSLRDSKSGNVSWSTMQPAVSVWFYGTRDDDMPDYLKINGTSGLALALADSQGEPLPLNQRAAPLFLSPGRNTLTYTVTPVRTPAPLRAGGWNANLDFRMIYD
ncbi:fimbrial protein [Erwinia sp. LJJL01]|uniref:fimbrial protein n=1 Tax=Erwinia sp. LJJL01 TaxID=3391839 RepID=UPI0010F42FE7